MLAKGVHDHLSSRIERTLVALFGQADKHLIGCRAIVILDLCVAGSGSLDGSADLGDIGRLREFHLDFSAAAKVDPERNRTANTAHGMC